MLQKNVPLADYTSFGIGGTAEYFAEINDTQTLINVLSEHADIQPVWLLGYGSNTLISDKGLPGMTFVIKGGALTVDGTTVIADAGVWWDDVVQAAIKNNLWGCELMSEIPGSVGAATFINITAYGQSVGPIVKWVDVWDPDSSTVKRMTGDQFIWDYKTSVFQQPEHADLIILRVCFALSDTPTQDIEYQKALDVAQELGISPDTLAGRRRIITEARSRAGSLWKPDSGQVAKTVGSFFRNPMVDQATAERIIQHDETGKTKEEVRKMNAVHGGDSKRVSAAHVMLAAGFSRGQQWGCVKFNDQNVLKIEALDHALAQEVYDVAMHVQAVVKQTFDIHLEPEARILGDFDAPRTPHNS